MLFAMISPVLTIAVNAQSMAKSSQKSLTEDQKIMHVLNRLGFGARPGDAQRVKAIGLKNYIEQQLDPSSLNDSVAESKLRNFDVLKLTNDQLFSKYPAPAALLDLVARQNGMNRREAQAERAEAREMRQNAQDGKGGDKKQDAMPANAPQGNSEEAMYQEQIQEMYQKYKLGRPQQISQQLNASRILRAVYSEKQLHEAMVDFWSNHFNVFANKQSVRWFLPEYDRDVIRPNALGNFKDLLLATAKSPAMLYYLDNFQSVAPASNQQNGRNGQQMNPQQLERLMKNPQARERVKQQRGINDQQLDEFIKQAQE
jgi:uncharacterized protein (DUF1800 family)